MKLTRKEAVEAIDGFLQDRGAAHDWDDFISIPIDNDRELDALRFLCAILPDLYPPAGPGHYCSDEGIRLLHRVLEFLKSKC
jgi:hypothetical protein